MVASLRARNLHPSGVGGPGRGGSGAYAAYTGHRVSLFGRDDIPLSLSHHVPRGATLTYPTQGMTSEVAFVEGHARCVIKRCRDVIYVEWVRREHHVLRELEASHLPSLISPRS